MITDNDVKRRGEVWWLFVNVGLLLLWIPIPFSDESALRDTSALTLVTLRGSPIIFRRLNQTTKNIYTNFSISVAFYSVWFFLKMYFQSYLPELICKKSSQTKGFSRFEIIINVLVSSFRFIWIPMLWVYGHYQYVDSYSAESDFSRQNLTSTDVRFCRLKSIPALWGLTLFTLRGSLIIFRRLKLELLTQFPASNDNFFYTFMKNVEISRLIYFTTFASITKLFFQSQWHFIWCDFSLRCI